MKLTVGSAMAGPWLRLQILVVKQLSFKQCLSSATMLQIVFPLLLSSTCSMLLRACRWKLLLVSFVALEVLTRTPFPWGAMLRSRGSAVLADLWMNCRSSRVVARLVVARRVMMTWVVGPLPWASWARVWILDEMSSSDIMNT